MYRGQDRAASYLRQVDAAMTAQTGVSFSAVRDDLQSSPVTPRISEAMSAHLPPADYARLVKDTFGMVGAEARDAPKVNLRIAALVAFTAENPDWLPGKDGAIYRETDIGVARVRTGYDFSQEKLGFLTSVSGGADLVERYGMAEATDSPYEFVGGALDIGDAMRGLEARLDAGTALRM